MTENNYSIKPLPNLPNVTGPKPPKAGEDRNKRQSSHKRSNQTPHSLEEEIDIFNEDNFTPIGPNDENPQHIDYRA